MSASPWDAEIGRLQEQIADTKAGVLQVREQINELNQANQARVAELEAFIDAEIDHVTVLQSLLDHACRQRDGDPLTVSLDAGSPPQPITDEENR